MESKISPLFNTNLNAIKNETTKQITPSEAHDKFASFLKNAINDVNQAQEVSNEKTNALVRGEIDDLHDVMITAQKASVMLQTATQVQNRALEAYREVMRMQI